MTRFIDALASEKAHSRSLRLALGAVTITAVVGMYLVKQVPVNLSLHQAPYLKAGDVMEVKNGVVPVPHPNVYAFGYYVWQQVNRWARNGQLDYPQQIATLQPYLTPSCQAQLLADVQQRAQAGELAARIRSVTELPGQVFSEWRVVPDGRDAWKVLLDLELTETVQGMDVKKVAIRYPVRVVRFDVDRERNPWQLAIDCYGTDRPERLTPSEVARAASGVDPKAVPAQPNTDQRHSRQNDGPTPATLPKPAGQ